MQPTVPEGFIQAFAILRACIGSTGQPDRRRLPPERLWRGRAWSPVCLCVSVVRRTELLVEKALEIASRYKKPLVADIGTGSGIIAVTLAKYLPEATVFATDISDEALAVARRNAQKHAVEKRITFLQGNLLEPLPRPVDIIVANLPYVTTVDVPRVNTIGFEPGLALHGGEDGLDLIKIMLNQVKNYLRPGACVLLEIGLGQRAPLMKFIKAAGLDVDIEYIKDLGGIVRVVCLLFK